MHIVLIAAGAIALWAWKTGRLRGSDSGDWAAIAAVLLGLRWLSTGQGILALVCFSGVAIWAAYRSQQFRRARMPVAEARELLGVSENADQASIRNAHRRLIAKVHPDVGGSADLARRVNAARDILLSEARNQMPSHRK
ncbi:DnaJ domain-containing protein [Parasphingopyxis lamellibrachiae]|uniref:DnaJ-like protein n=1 Tax=Parasphingopyxis lamellibrachiae TaxID=680125 RepID=A0A3D9FK39_9SPHN|nr:DnaJ domain-containing protein [Parasphingopyxis lamellibrachiae]RED17456.1 DnaJ-like protein [Parasphingopyxis lamellibrachiae]